MSRSRSSVRSCDRHARPVGGGTDDGSRITFGGRRGCARDRMSRSGIAIPSAQIRGGSWDCRGFLDEGRTQEGFALTRPNACAFVYADGAERRIRRVSPARQRSRVFVDVPSRRLLVFEADQARLFLRGRGVPDHEREVSVPDGHPVPPVLDESDGCALGCLVSVTQDASVSSPRLVHRRSIGDLHRFPSCESRNGRHRGRGRRPSGSSRLLGCPLARLDNWREDHRLARASSPSRCTHKERCPRA